MKSLFFDNRHLLFVTITVVLVSGLSAYLSIARLEDPRIVNRHPIVLTPAPGVSAERVESLITEPLEEALQEIVEIKELQSTSRAGMSVISISLHDEVQSGENERIFSRIRDRLAGAAASLPPEAHAPALDDERDPVAFTRIVGLTWERDSDPRVGLLTRLAEDLADRLRNVDGTDLVRLYGEVDEEILVTIDRDRARSVGLDAKRIADLLASADSKRSAGVLRTPERDLPVEVRGEFDAVERVRRTPLVESDGLAIAQLGDVATVHRAWQDPPVEIGITDGARTVFVAARMAPEAQIDDWSTATDDVLADARETFGGGVSVRMVFDQARYTTDRLRELGGNLLLGVLVVGVVIFFVMGLRSALIVGSAIPLVAGATLFGVLLSGGQLHQMSIFGMIIALGLLIDNAIVVVDESRKRREAGMSAREATRDTLAHLRGPLFASTLTTALAFAPIMLLPGDAGDFVGYIGVSVILAICFSYALSMTVIAALAGVFGKPVGPGVQRSWWRHGVSGEWFTPRARRVLEAGLRQPIALMLLAALPAIAGFAVGPHLGRQFFPPTDRDMFDLRLWMPEQTSIQETRATLERVESALREDLGVERVHWLAGGSFPSVYYNQAMTQDRASHFAHAVIDATSAAEVQRMVPALQARLDRSFPEAQIVVRSFGQGPPIEADIEFRLYGSSVAELQRLGDEVRLAMQRHPEVLHTRTSMPRGEPKLWYDANEEAARLAGYSLDEIALELNGMLDGAVGGSIVEDLESLPVRVRTGGEARSNLEQFRDGALVQDPSAWTPLESLGSLVLRPEFGGVTRFNAMRSNIIEGYTRDGALPIDVTLQVQEILEEAGFTLPPGYSLELGGSLEQDEEAVANLLTFAPVLGTIMVAALILTFRSVILAMTLLAVGGLSVGLALLSTWSIGFPISFNTILGTLGLMGVAFNDTIVVLAAIRDDDRARAGDPRAIAEAVLGCARHVVSTTLTTIGGFLPLLLLVGGEFWPSLAIVLAGGVGGATLLALGFAPGAYALMAPLLARKQGEAHALSHSVTPAGVGA